MRRALTCSLLVAILGLIANPTCIPANAESGSPNLAKQLASRLAASWPARQNAGGDFDDYVLQAKPSQTRDWYGPAVLGAALVLTGQRTANKRVLDSGLKSVSYAISRRAGLSDRQGSSYTASRPSGYAYPFSLLALSDVWNSIHKRWPSAGADASPPEWRLLLTQAAPIVAPSPAQRPGNQLLLEHLEWQSLIASNLTSRFSYSILAHRGAWATKIDQWVDSWLAKAPANYSADGTDQQRNLLLSDYPAWPYAYHAFSVGLLARMIHYSGKSRRLKLMPKLREAVRTSRILASPLGDVAYGGRSSMMPWALSFTAYAALVVANDTGTSATEAAEDRRLARTVLDRLSTGYFSPAAGLMLMPSMAGGIENSLAALDPYPCAVPYSGLTLLGLEWVGAERDGPMSTPARPSSPVTTRVGGPGLDSSLIVLKSGRLWLGLRGERHDFGLDQDLRYDLGPSAAQQLVNGVWRWLLPTRPIRTTDAKSSWLRLHEGRTVALPTAKSIAVSRSEMMQSVRFYSRGRPQGQALKVVYSSASCGGMHVSIGAPSQGSLETVFWLPANSVSQQGLSAFSGPLRIVTNIKPTIKVSKSAPSASHSNLNQVALEFPNTRHAIGIDLCLVNG